VNKGPLKYTGDYSIPTLVSTTVKAHKVNVLNGARSA